MVHVYKHQNSFSHSLTQLINIIHFHLLQYTFAQAFIHSFARSLARSPIQSLAHFNYTYFVDIKNNLSPIPPIFSADSSSLNQLECNKLPVWFIPESPQLLASFSDTRPFFNLTKHVIINLKTWIMFVYHLSNIVILEIKKHGYILWYYTPVYFIVPSYS